MALSNSQYDQLMRTYEQKQLDNEHRLQRHFEEAYARIPKLQELDHAISSLSLSKARILLEGDDSALIHLKEELSDLIAEKKRLLVENGFPENYLELTFSCPDCKDTGYINTNKCHCFEKAIVDLLYTQSNLQEILEEENFSNFSLDYYSRSHIDPRSKRSSREAIEVALRNCLEFVETFNTEFRNILLYGDTGVGKTFLSHCIAKELIDRAHSVIYFSAAQIFDLFAKNTFGKNAEQDSDALEHIYNCDLLIIDDLGTELSNSFTTSQLFICLNERILRKKSTIISTNLALDKIQSLYSERIFSRISSHYAMIRLTGDDIRIQKKLLNLGGTRNVTP